MIDLDKTQIQELFGFCTAAEGIHAAYAAVAAGQVQTPPVAQLAFEQANGDCCVKTGYINGSEGFVVKVSTGFYDNPQRGLASSNGMNLVFCAQTGVPLAILRDEGWLTDMRTGIGGALTTAALAPAGFEQVLIVGTGLQARHQARCLARLVRERGLRVAIWGRDHAKAQATAQELVDSGIDAQAVSDLQQACGQAQAIITCTPSKVPLIEADWIRPGTHITAVGADCLGKQELATDLIQAADILICDDPAQSLHHGEFQHLPVHKPVIVLGDILRGQHPGRSHDTQITIADLTGLAVQDAAVSLSVLRAVPPLS